MNYARTLVPTSPGHASLIADESRLILLINPWAGAVAGGRHPDLWRGRRTRHVQPERLHWSASPRVCLDMDRLGRPRPVVPVARRSGR